MTVFTILLFAAAFVGGTVVHELTHWLVARVLGADVRRVVLVPPHPRVDYIAPSPGADRTIRASTVLCAVPVLVACLLLGLGRPLEQRLALAILGVSYVPKSETDWDGLDEYIKCIAD